LPVLDQPTNFLEGVAKQCRLKYVHKENWTAVRLKQRFIFLIFVFLERLPKFSQLSISVEQKIYFNVMSCKTFN
jgi:hypothetical protein